MKNLIVVENMFKEEVILNLDRVDSIIRFDDEYCTAIFGERPMKIKYNFKDLKHLLITRK